MERDRQRERRPVEADGAALVRRDEVSLVDAVPAEPGGELDQCDDGAPVPLGKRDRVTDVVAVPVRERDDVDALGCLLGLRARRVSREERVDVDPLAVGGVQPEGRVAEPRERRFRHRSPFRSEVKRA